MLPSGKKIALNQYTKCSYIVSLNVIMPCQQRNIYVASNLQSEKILLSDSLSTKLLVIDAFVRSG